jgi:hypothetical protein
MRLSRFVGLRIVAPALWLLVGCPQWLEDGFISSDPSVTGPDDAATGRPGPDVGAGGGGIAMDAGAEAGSALDAAANVRAPTTDSDASMDGSADASPAETPEDAASPPPPDPCSGGSLGPDSETCYYLAATALTWSEARQACMDAGQLLVQIDSAGEDAFVASLSPENLWIGASDTAVENSFVWSDGSAIVFANWGGDQPDAFIGPDCVEKRQETGEPWYDQPCTNHRLYVCEAPRQ